MTTKQTTTPTFHLGLTMAGAVSAGCYSAGVIDYLFEILDIWEKAKNGETTFDSRLIPQHKVVIETMGGASAGGMTTMMTALYALSNNVKSVVQKPEDYSENRNILYDSWVHLNDDKTSNTFEQLWKIDDLASNKLLSLLNSNPVDSIANRAFSYYNYESIASSVQNLPSYISKNLEILLSHAVLRGIPLEVDFSTFQGGDMMSTTNPMSRSVHKPTHTSYEHALISHFRFNHGQAITNNFSFWFNPNNQFEMDRMKIATIATGAFPVGLKFRKLSKETYSEEYIKGILKKSIFSDFSKDDPDENNLLVLNNFPKDYESITVDGGAVNNEPYGEILSILREKSKQEDTIEINHGVIMIDPFPDMVEPDQLYQEEEDLFDVIPSILGTLREQSKIKRKEMISNILDKNVKGQIYPKRHYYDEAGNYISTEKYPIASASFDAFGGFLHHSFRTHDFFLGRDNARNFFRYYFSLPYDPSNPNSIHKDWTQEMIHFFGFIHPKDGKTYLPIVPDLNLLNVHQFSSTLTQENTDTISENRFNFSGIEKNSYTISERPKLQTEDILRFEPHIKKRVLKILEMSKNRVSSKDQKKEKQKDEHYEYWLEEYRRKSFFQRVSANLQSKGVDIVFSLTKKSLADRLTTSIVNVIVKDLIDKNLLDLNRK